MTKTKFLQSDSATTIRRRRIRAGACLALISLLVTVTAAAAKGHGLTGQLQTGRVAGWSVDTPERHVGACYAMDDDQHNDAVFSFYLCDTLSSFAGFIPDGNVQQNDLYGGFIQDGPGYTHYWITQWRAWYGPERDYFVATSDTAFAPGADARQFAWVSWVYACPDSENGDCLGWAKTNNNIHNELMFCVENPALYAPYSPSTEGTCNPPWGGDGDFPVNLGDRPEVRAAMSVAFVKHNGLYCRYDASASTGPGSLSYSWSVDGVASGSGAVFDEPLGSAHLITLTVTNQYGMYDTTYHQQPTFPNCW